MTSFSKVLYQAHFMHIQVKILAFKGQENLLTPLRNPLEANALSIEAAATGTLISPIFQAPSLGSGLALNLILTVFSSPSFMP